MHIKIALTLKLGLIRKKIIFFSLFLIMKRVSSSYLALQDHDYCKNYKEKIKIKDASIPKKSQWYYHIYFLFHVQLQYLP